MPIMGRTIWADFIAFHSVNRTNPLTHIRAGFETLPRPVIRGLCGNIMSTGDADEWGDTVQALKDDQNWCTKCVAHYKKVNRLA